MKHLISVFALVLAAAPAVAFDLIECDVDEVFGNAGPTTGWGGTGGPLMGNWELDNSGASGSTISTGNSLQTLANGIHEWTLVTGTTYQPPTTSAASFTAADIDQTEGDDAAALSRHIMMFVHSSLTRDGLDGWAAVKTPLATATTLGVCKARIYGDARLVGDADIYINDDFANASPALFQGTEGLVRIGPPGILGTFELQTVVAHEFGHAQGAAHTLRNTSLMFATQAPFGFVPIQEDDANILRWLYPVSPAPVPPDRNLPNFITCDRLLASTEVVIGNSAGGACQLSPTRSVSWPFAFGVFLLILAADRSARRRRRG